MSELKPCPFCGALAVCHTKGSAVAGVVWIAECVNHACPSQPFTHGCTAEDATDNWNTRAEGK